MAEQYKKYNTGYKGAEVVGLLGSIPNIDERVTALERRHVEYNYYNSAKWDCRHNLGSKPSVTVVDEKGNMIIADVQHVNENYLIVTFGMSATGRIILN